MINGEEYPPYLYETASASRVRPLTVVRAERAHRRAARQLFAIGQRHAQPPARLRDASHAVPARAQPHRPRAGARLPELGRRAAVPDGPQHPHRAPDQDRHRGVHQPHLAVPLQALADPTRASRNPRWYRQNWMAVEFNLLYRWHSLVPSALPHRRRGRAGGATRCSTRDAGDRARPRRAASRTPPRQPAGRIGLFNIAARGCGRPSWPASRRARAVRLRPYNDYRTLPASRACGAFEEISGDPRSSRRCATLYGSVDDIEFYVGLFAEDVRPNAVLPPLIGRMVAIDAFSQAFTNPLLAPRVFNAATFSPLGWESSATRGRCRTCCTATCPAIARTRSR